MEEDTEQLNQLDDLMREIIKLIDQAEDAHKIPPHLTFNIGVDGCKAIKEWKEEDGNLKKIEPVVIFAKWWAK